MKRLFLMGFFALAVCLSVGAQESLSGRVYHCANMMKDEMNELKSDFNKDLQKDKDFTAEERKEANQMVQAMTNAIVTTMTVTFLSNKELELSVLVKFDDEKAKAGGVPWLFRKMVAAKIKSKLKKSSFTSKAPYTFDGKTVKLSNPKRKAEMLFRLTSDGKALLYTAEDKTVRLARTK